MLGADQGSPPSSRSLSTDVESDALAPTTKIPTPVRGLLVVAVAVLVGLAGLSTEVMPRTGSPPSAISTANATPGTEKQVAAAPEASPRGTPSATAKPAAGPGDRTTKARVVRVIDGDTILVAFGGKQHEVQYLGIEAPATLGRRALSANKALVAGKSIVLEADVSQTDRSGRLLRYVWLKRGSTWTLVNLELVRRGFAKVATHSPDRKYADDCAAAERYARARHLGLWDPASKGKPKPKATSKPAKASRPPVGPVPSDRR